MPINDDEIDREYEDLEGRLDQGLISRDEYNREMQDIQHSIRDAYEADQEAALRAVAYEWGI